MTEDKEKEVLGSIIQTTMYLTLIIGWIKGKGLWKECTETLKIPPDMGDLK